MWYYVIVNIEKSSIPYVLISFARFYSILRVLYKLLCNFLPNAFAIVITSAIHGQIISNPFYKSYFRLETRDLFGPSLFIYLFY